jgi:hypothetical protein
VIINLEAEDEIPSAMHVIRQAYEAVSD